MQKTANLSRLILCCGLLACTLSACGAGSRASLPAVVGAPESAALPGAAQPLPATGSPLSLPVPSQLAVRSTAFTLADGFAMGKDFDAGKPNNRASAAGNDCVFAPSFSAATADSASGLAYAIYDFHLPNYGGALADVEFAWTDRPAAGSFFAGLADFSADKWQWFADPAADVMHFSSIPQYINPADHLYLVVAVTGTDAAILSGIQISEQQTPTADLTSDVDSGVAPLTVNFDASGSTDADGTIATYEWDFNGDDNFTQTVEEVAGFNDPTPPAVTYDVVGTYDVQVRVTDDDGKTDIAQLQINVTASLPPVAVLTAGPPTTGPKPFMVVFDASTSMDPDGTVDAYAWDFDGDNSFGEAGAESAAQDDPTPPAVTYTAVGTFNPQVRVTDNDGNSDVQAVQITVTNTPPSAALTADVLEMNAPLMTTFFADGSTDAGGSITDYEWDLDADGVFNEPGAEQAERGNAITAPQTYSTPGAYTITVRVTDDDGAADTATVDVTAHGWLALTVDEQAGSDEGYGVNLLVQSGFPVICHSTLNPYGLRLVRSATTEGTVLADWTGAQIMNGTYKPVQPSFALISGRPAVSFFADTGANGLYYNRSNTQLGMDPLNWLTTPVAIDLADTAGLSSRLLEVAAKPAIAYNAVSTGDLRYAWSTADDGSAGWSAFTIDGDGAGAQSVGSFLSASIVSGCPAVAYSSATAPVGLLYIKSQTATGANVADWTTNGTHTTIISPGGACSYPSLQLVNLFPGVAFVDPTGALRFARSSSATGSAAWTASTIETGISAEFASLAMIGSYPAVAYHNQTSDRARFVISTDANGAGDASWANEQDVTTSGSAGRFTSLVMLATGRPAMAFRDDGNGVLKYAVMY